MRKIIVFFSTILSALTVVSQDLPLTNHLSLWLDAGTGITLSDTVVTKWIDQSSHNRVAQQTTATRRPAFINQKKILNNQPIVHFTNDYLTLGNTLLVDSIRQVFIVMQHDVFANYSMVLSKGYTLDGAFTLGCNSTGKARLYIDNYTVNATSAWNKTYPSISMLQLDPNGQLVLQENQIDLLRTAATVDFVGTNAYSFSIGGTLQGSNAYYFNGSVAEIIIYDTLLTSQQITLVYDYLQNKYTPPLDLEANITINNFSDTVLSAYKPWFTNYAWSDGSNDSLLTVSKTGTYAVSVTDIFGFASSSSVTVTYPTPYQLSDTTICLGDTIAWNLGLDDSYTYLWSDGSNESSLKISVAGNYSCTITDSKGNDSILSSITVSVDSFPEWLTLGNDTTLCAGQAIGIQYPTSGISTYLWNDGTADSMLTINLAGIYHITATNTRGCLGRDTININIKGIAPKVGFTFDTVCYGQLTTFTDTSLPGEETDAIQKWLWDFGNDLYSTQQDTAILLNSTLTTSVCITVTATSGCENSICNNAFTKSLPETSFEIVDGNLQCLNADIIFIDTNNYILPIENRIWDFGDGNYALSDSTAIHGYNVEKSYTVSLTVQINGCVDSSTQTLTIVNSIPLGDSVTIIAPKNNYIYKTDSLTFAWESIENAIYYQIILAADVNFTTLIVDSINIITNSINLPLSEDYDSIFWKVYAYNLCGDIVKSSNYKIKQFPNKDHLSLWLDAGAGITLSDTVVTKWIDQSSHNRLAQQTDNSKRPALIEQNEILNNQPIVHFTNDYLTLGNTLPVDSIRQVFIVMQHDVFANYSMVLSKGYTLDGAFTIGCNSNGKARLYLDNYTVNATSAWNKTYPSISMLQLDPNGQLVLQENQIDLLSTAATVDFVGTNAYSFSIGGTLQGSNAYYFNGLVAEIIIYDTLLTSQQITLVYDYLQNKYAPPINLGEDISVNYGFSKASISAYKPWFTDYQWTSNYKNISTDSIISVDEPGTYYITVTDIFGFESSDSITVEFNVKPQQINDTNICLGDTIYWNPALDGPYTYAWSNSKTTSTITITESGNYALIITDTNGYSWYSDTISVTVDEFPATATLGNDTSLCSGNRIYLQNGYLEATEYFWSTGETTDYIVIDTAGTYTLTVFNSNGCSASDTATFAIQGQAPVIDYSYSNICEGSTTQFTDLSITTDGSSITSWTWSFGDATSSTLQNPAHQYAQTGTYELNFKISADNNCNNSIKDKLTIYEQPTAAFIPNEVCSFAEVSFTDQSTSNDDTLSNWLWTFPDNSTSNIQNPDYIFEEDGSMPVQLICTTKHNCADTLNKAVTVRPGPNTDFSISAACQGKTVYLTNQSESYLDLPLVYKWTFADGTSSSKKNESLIYQSTGIYPISLKTTQSYNSCSSTKTDTIVVSENPTAGFLHDSVCVNNDIQFTDNSSSPAASLVSYLYLIDSLGTFSEANPTIEFSSPGNYMVEYRVTDAKGCTDTLISKITAYALPVSLFQMSSTRGAVPLYVEFENQSTGANNYFWDFGDGNSSAATNPSNYYTDSGYYTVQLIAYSIEGCANSSQQIFKGIIPTTNLVVSNTIGTISEGYLSVEAYLQNMGTLDQDNVELYFKTNYAQTIKEVYAETLSSGEAVYFTFSTQLQINPKTPLTHVCVWAEPADSVDDVPDNNEDCYAFADAFTLLKSYPNPTTDEFTIEYIVPFDAPIKIRMFNLMGKELAPLYSGTASEGYNQHSINISHFQKGTYIYQIEYEDIRKSCQIVIY